MHRTPTAILALLLGAALAGCVSSGDAAPSFTLTDSTGEQVRLADHEGKPVVLFFASVVGCAPCITETKRVLAPLHAELGDDVAFLTISIVRGETDEDLEAFKADTGATWPHARDTDEVAQRYDVLQLSVVAVLDEDHRIVLKKADPSRTAIEEALA